MCLRDRVARGWLALCDLGGVGGRACATHGKVLATWLHTSGSWFALELPFGRLDEASSPLVLTSLVYCWEHGYGWNKAALGAELDTIWPSIAGIAVSDEMRQMDPDT